MKREVSFCIESKLNDQSITQQHHGIYYDKEGVVYFRYAEAGEEFGKTMTTVRLDPMEIRVIRQGDVSAEQRFLLGGITQCDYETVHGVIPLRMETTRIEIWRETSVKRVFWSFLLAHGEHQAEKVEITINVLEIGGKQT